MSFTFAAIADLHFGPRALFQGKLRKLSDQAPALTDAFVHRMNTLVRPDLVIALGDLIQDESPALDRERYGECIQRLSMLDAPLALVAGNHDTLQQSEQDLARAWQRDLPLHYSFDQGPYHFIVLHTIERQDVDVHIPDEQVQWLRDELAATPRPAIVAMHHSAAEQQLTGNRWFEQAPHLALVRNRKAVRDVLASSGKVVLVLNGHVHWNHFDVHDGIPYLTVQSLTENVEEDAPGRAANATALVRLEERSISVTVDGAAPTRYEHRR